MLKLLRRPSVGDVARVRDGEYGGQSGRVVAIERGAHGEEVAVILIDDRTLPAIPVSAIVIDGPRPDLFDHDRREDPSDHELEYEKLRWRFRTGG